MEQVEIECVALLTNEDDAIGSRLIGSHGHLRRWLHTPGTMEFNMTACFKLEKAVSMMWISLVTVSCAYVEVEGGQWTDQGMEWTSLALCQCKPIDVNASDSKMSSWFFSQDKKKYLFFRVVCHRFSDDRRTYGLESMNVFGHKEEEELYDCSSDSTMEELSEESPVPSGSTGHRGHHEPPVHGMEDSDSSEEDEQPVMPAGRRERWTRAFPKGRSCRAPFKGKRPKSRNMSESLQCGRCCECVLKLYKDNHYCPFVEDVIPKGCFEEAPPEWRREEKRKREEDFPSYHLTVTTVLQPLTAAGGEPTLHHGCPSYKRARTD